MESEGPRLPDVRCIVWLDDLRAITLGAEPVKQKPAAANQATGRRIVVGADLEQIMPSCPRQTASLCERIYAQIAVIPSYDANLRRRNLCVNFCG
jgi:hypothetical protein